MSVCVLVLPDRRNKASTDEAQPVAKRARQDDKPADKVRIAVSICLPCACAVELTCLAFLTFQREPGRDGLLRQADRAQGEYRQREERTEGAAVPRCVQVQ